MGEKESIKEEDVSKERKYREGEILFRERESPREIYLIKEGQVEILKGERQIAVLGEGDFLGEMGVIDGRPRSATAVAKSDASVLVIDVEELKKKMEEDPMVGALITTLIRRLRETDRKLTEV